MKNLGDPTKATKKDGQKILMKLLKILEKCQTCLTGCTHSFTNEILI